MGLSGVQLIQGVIGRVISTFEIKSMITPELYFTQSYYQLIVTTTLRKFENITVRV